MEKDSTEKRRNTYDEDLAAESGLRTRIIVKPSNVFRNLAFLLSMDKAYRDGED